jgi:hypothetical protein
MNGTLEMELKIGMSLRRELEEFGGWINGDNQPIIFDSKSVSYSAAQYSVSNADLNFFLRLLLIRLFRLRGTKRDCTAIPN